MRGATRLIPGGRLTRTLVAALILVAVALITGEDLLNAPGSDQGDGGADVRAGERLRAKVTRVVDGDTVIARIAGRDERLRYIGIDTPESVQPNHPVECFGPEAAERNAELVEGREVELELGREVEDRYGRLLAYVRRGGVFVNAELVRGGYARTLTIPPNDRHAPELRRLESGARRSGIGLWGQCG